MPTPTPMPRVHLHASSSNTPLSLYTFRCLRPNFHWFVAYLTNPPKGRPRHTHFLTGLNPLVFLTPSLNLLRPVSMIRPPTPFPTALDEAECQPPTAQTRPASPPTEILLQVRVHAFVCVCVLQVCYVHSAACTSVLRVLSDWTLGAAVYPSKKLATSVRRHTKVLANGEGCLD